MNRLILLGLAHVLMFGSCESQYTEAEVAVHLESTPDPKHTTEVIDQAIAKMETVVAQAAKLTNDGILLSEETEKHYNDMQEILTDAADLANHPDNAYRFIKAKGIDRIIFPYMDIKNSKFREPILVLLKLLFETVPNTTDAVIPISAIDKLLDIFENDDNLSVKAHVVDIFNLWLPGNPKAQLRIMKLKGLEPFYKQVSKLDISKVETLLYLFNKILDEHIKAREDIARSSQAGASKAETEASQAEASQVEASQADAEKLRLYQQAGLIERMSTRAVCNGLLNIFQTTWSYVTKEDHDIIGPVLDIVMKIKPYCIQNLKQHRGSTDLFIALLEYVEDSTKKGFLESLNFNVTDIKEVLEDYITEFERRVRDEF